MNRTPLIDHLSRRVPLALMLLALLALTLMPPAATLAQDGDKPTELEQGLQQLRLGKYSQAATALDALAAKSAAGSDTAAQALYFAGRAWQADGANGKAVASYRLFIERCASHELIARVRFRLADALLETGRNAEALELIASGTHDITGDTNTHAISARYVSLADRLYDGVSEPDPLIPDREIVRHDYARAVTLYGSALTIGLPDAEAARVQLQRARAMQAASQWANAVGAWRELTDRTDKLSDGKATVGQEAAFRMAEAAYRANQLDIAASSLAGVIEAGKAHPWYADALYLATELYARPGWDAQLSRKHGEQFLAEFGSDERAPAMRLWLARQEAGRGENIKAAEGFAAFITRYPEREADVASARLERARALMRAGEHDQANAAYAEYLKRHPGDAGVNAARSELRVLILQRAERADSAARNAAPEADQVALRSTAIDAWGDFIEAYPSDNTVVTALMRIASLRELGDDFSGSIEVLRRIAAQYPHYAQQSLLDVARIYEQKLHQEDLALLEYRRIREMRLSDQGQIERLTSPSLGLQPTLVVRGDAKPAVSVTTRNITDLICRAFRLDLQEFFRRKRETGNVERLMVDVLRPDHAWTAEIPEYRDYRELQTSIETPISEPGAWITTFATDKHRGCTMVLISDLQLIVKNSPKQLLVLAINARTGAPWAGVKLLTMAGKTIEGTTDRDGVWVLDTDQLTAEQREGISDLTDAHVFASADKHYAFHNFDPFDVQDFAFTPKAFLFTDRPLYRAGELVSFKLMVRDVRDGAYALPGGTNTYHATLTGPTGIKLWEKDITLSAYGTCDDQIRLSDEAAAGTYRVTLNPVTRSSLPSGTQVFEVREFERPDYEIAATLDKPQYRYRENMKLSLIARRYTGAPIANRSIAVRVGFVRAEYQPSDDTGAAWFESERNNSRMRIEGQPMVFNVTTDAAGKAELSFMPTPVAPPVGTTFWHMVIELEGAVEIGQPVRNTAMSAITGVTAVATIKPRDEVVKQGEEAIITIRGESLINTPVQLTGTLRLWQQESVNDLDPRKAVHSQAVQLGENGRAEVRVRMSKAGNWVARFESRNAEGQTVEALATFKVIRPGENERTDLLVLADRTDYFAGEEAKLTLLSPIEAQTALLCVEADRVLHWRTLRLERGQTTLTLPVEASWMPNVRISVTAISGERSFRGECQLSARKLLKLEIKTDKQDYKPGETVQVSIVATDSLGRPVEAEVALAAVDESIFDLEPEKTGSIRAAFYNIVRQLAVRTGTSLGWEYPGTVSEIDPDIMNDSRTRDRAMAKDAEELGARLAERMEAARENNDAMSDELRRNFRPADDPAPAPAAPGFNSSTGMGGNLGGGGGPGGQGGFTYRRARGGGGMRADSIDLLQALNARADFRLTAGWLPAIHTGKDGKATASFKLPENVGSWRLTAHGITTDTHVGEARGKITTKLPFYGEVDAPRLCVEGDRFAIGAQFVNETGEAGKVSVTLGEERRRTPGEGSPSVIEVAVDRTRATGLGLSLDGVLDSLLGANLRVRPGAFTQTGNDAPTAVIVGADADQLMKVIIGKRADGANVLVKDIAVLRQVTAGPAPSVTIDRDTKNGEAAWISSQWLAEQAGEVDLMALGSIGGNVDSLRRKIVIQPFGDPSSSGFSGTLQADGRASHIVQLPDNAVPYATVLVVQVTPSMADSLLDSLDYLKEYPYGCIEQTVNRFFPALAVFSAISDLQHRDPKLARECFAIAEDGLARMLGHQAQDGGWGWWGTGARNPQLTALCYEALVTSRRMDLPVPDDALIRARDWLVRYIRDSREAAPDRAMMSVLMALATPGDRRSVTPPSNLKAMIARYQAAIMQGTADIVARASIAWSRLNDMASAQAAADALAALALRDGNTAHWTAGAAQQSYGGSDVETTALALQALAMAKRDTTLQESAVEWLEASKGPNGKGQWRATRDTAMVVQAYAAYMQGRRLTSTDGTILVSVNGAKVGEIKLGTIDGTRNHTLMLRGTQGLKAGNNQVQLSCDSTVRPRYHGTLRTIVPAEQIAAVSNHGLRISRRYIPATRGVDASQVFERNPGNSPADVAAEGDFVDVLIEMSSTQVRDEVMIEEPIPAGFEPITSTMQGVNGTSPQRIEHRPGKVVMFYDQLPAGTTSVRFRARAVRPGRYRVLPGNVSMMYFPEINAHGADAAFTILSGSEWTSRVEATPAWRSAALVNTAQAAMASHDAAAERKAWGELLAFNGLRRSIHEQALQRLLILSLDRGDLAEAKNWLVNLATSRHSFPALDIRQSVLAADAWKGTEPMQALAWYRSAMSQVYDAERQTVDLSVTPAERAETLRMMLTRYPDMARLTHDMADQAVMATAAAPADKRSAVYIAAMKRLAAEEPTGYWNRLAMMNICEHLFQIGKHTEARDLGRQWLATLDPATEPLADNVTYLVAITSFALGEYDVAREYAKKLVDTRYATPPSGYGAQDRHQYFVNADERNEWKRRSVWAPNWSENRPKAALILGQLAHADGNLADAVKWYTMARSDSQDAQLALNELTGEELGVPAFVMAKPGEAAQLEVTGRNVPKATVAVYPFDLLYCFTVRKHLRELHTIDLTGLRAERELEVELESKPYARYTKKVAVDKLEKGAYLVLVKSGDTVRSSIIIVSSLQATARRDGNVLRVTVSKADGSPVAGAWVKVSDGNGIVANGKTDVRGIFQSNGGNVVLVERNGEYALLPDVK